MRSERKFDSMITGFIPGMIFPFIGLVVIWLIRYEAGFFSFLAQTQHQGILSKLISLSALTNLLLFFLFIWTRRTFSARGVIFATLVVAFVMLVLKIS